MSNTQYIIRTDTFCPTLLALIILLVSACSSRPRETEYTPWGTPIDAPDDTLSASGHITLDDIVTQGELIMLTISGPETYYDYHGYGMGLQYLLCEDFASQLGVKVRVELCKDTTELSRRLNASEGDIIACPGARADGLQCGPQWYVSHDNTTLQQKIKEWYTADKTDKIRRHQTTLLANGGVTRRVYAPILNRDKGVISRWDHLFRKYSQQYRLDWRMMAAQCYQESCFDPKAHSWAGACGLMQIMPSTARYLGLSVENIYDPEQNIAAAAKFMSQLIRDFSDAPSQYDRICFALASYNGGKFHVRDAMALARKDGHTVMRWQTVGQYILKLAEARYYTDPVVKYGYMRGSETYGYVNRIIQRWQEYGGRVPSSERAGGYVGPSTQPTISSQGTPRPAKRKHKYDV